MNTWAKDYEGFNPFAGKVDSALERYSKAHPRYLILQALDDEAQTIRMNAEKTPEYIASGAAAVEHCRKVIALCGLETDADAVYLLETQQRIAKRMGS